MYSPQQIEQLRQIIADSRKLVFFGGAGVSTESGIPDFRSEAARAATQEAYGTVPEEILSAEFFASHPEVFYRYVWEFLYNPQARPNPAHAALAQLEGQGTVSSVITQNIDGLHEAAGSKDVWLLHGSFATFHCVDCTRTWEGTYAIEQHEQGENIPRCQCLGILKPDVVLYGEALSEGVIDGAVRAISEADTLIVAGTSLAVYPAAGLVQLFNGENLIVINKSPTPADGSADLVINGPVGEVLSQALPDPH